MNVSCKFSQATNHLNQPLPINHVVGNKTQIWSRNGLSFLRNTTTKYIHMIPVSQNIIKKWSNFKKQCLNS